MRAIRTQDGSRMAQHPGRSRGSQIFAASGTTLEWYDFTLYAYLAPVISELFFPKDVTGSELGSLLATFGVFAAGFLVRPLGAIFFGRYGDTRGRRRALLLSIVLMTLPIFVIGLLPTYDDIGWGAPILLLALRLITGFSVGGEFSGVLVALTESGRQDRRGFVAATAQFTSGIGVLIASVLVTILHGALSNAQMADFGWRIPFFVGAALGLTALVLRRHMQETPSFEAAKEAGALADNPLGEAVRRERGPLFYVFMLTAYMGVAYYTAATFLPSYLQSILDAKPEEVFIGTTAGAVIYAFVCPLAGALSDRVGRKPVMFAASLALLVFTWPVFLLMGEVTFFTIVFGQVALIAMVLLFTGPFSAVVAELFPTSSRYSGMAVAYNVGNAIFAGTAPLIGTALVKATGYDPAPAFYVMAFSLAILAVLARMPETYHKRLTLKPAEEPPVAGELSGAT
jgi:MHS family proline/betaine transporter-like MFS transporter